MYVTVFNILSLICVQACNLSSLLHTRFLRRPVYPVPPPQLPAPPTPPADLQADRNDLQRSETIVVSASAAAVDVPEPDLTEAHVAGGWVRFTVCLV